MKLKFGKKNKAQQKDIVYPTNEKQGNGSLKKNESENVEQPSGLKTKIIRALKENILLLFTISSIGIGIGLGFILRASTNFSPPVKAYFGFPGEIFLRSLKFLILPLISSSLITGIAGLGTQKTGKIAVRALIFYFCSTFSAVIVGLILVSTIKPGNLNRATRYKNAINPLANEKVNTIDTIFDLIRNLFPDNMVEMTFQLYKSKLEPHYTIIDYYNSSQTFNSSLNSTDFIINSTQILNKTMINPQKIQILEYYKATGDSRRSLNVLGLVVFCITLGAVLARMNERGRPMVQFFEALNEASIHIIRLVMWVSPLGISSLVCVAVLEMEDPETTFKSISYYMMTVLVGLAIQGFIVLPAAYLIISRKNVLLFAKNMAEALMVAFATASSAATLPITFKCIEEKNKIPKMISRFVLPVGATVNLDGTALYEAVASIFIAQMNDMKLGFVDLVVTSITATLASIGAAGIPSAGLITMVIVLSALNIPQDQISLIYAVDWFLDRFRTMINVWGDSIATGSVAHMSRREVAEYEEEQRMAGENGESNNQIDVIVQEPFDPHNFKF